MDLREPTVTKVGILVDDQAQCQALFNRITVEIDMKLELLSYQKGVKVPGRNLQNSDYNQVFDETARWVNKAVTGRVCQVSVKVM